jgi:hypothetical protein
MTPGSFSVRHRKSGMQLCGFAFLVPVPVPLRPVPDPWSLICRAKMRLSPVK